MQVMTSLLVLIRPVSKPHSNILDPQGPVPRITRQTFVSKRELRVRLVPTVFVVGLELVEVDRSARPARARRRRRGGGLLAEKNQDNKTLRAVVLLKRKIQDRRRPPAVVLREGAPLFDRGRHRVQNLRRHRAIERNKRNDLALFELPLVACRVIFVS